MIDESVTLYFEGGTDITTEVITELLKMDKSSIELFVSLSYKKMNTIRANKYLELKQLGFEFTSFIHKESYISNISNIGENCFIFEDNTIQPYVKIGDNCVLWSGNHIGHHSTIGNHVFITSHVVISGCCNIKDSTFFGVNSTVRDETVVEEYSLIGMGCILTKDTSPGDIWFGAKPFKKEMKSQNIDSISHKTNG